MFKIINKDKALAETTMQALVAKHLTRPSFEEMYELFVIYGFKLSKWPWYYIIRMPETAAFFAEHGWDIKDYINKCRDYSSKTSLFDIIANASSHYD